jgi:glyoxylate/hydroxypyruvate reductase A
MAVLFLAALDAAVAWRAELERLIPGIDLRVWPELGDPTAIEAALVWRSPPGLLASLPNLRLIVSLGAGVDGLVDDPLLPPGVPIVRLVDPYMTVAMSEYVQLQVLRLHRQDVTYLVQQRHGRWQPLPQPNAAERRVGVLGLGVLGGDAALKLRVLGFEVMGWSRTEKKLPGIRCFHGATGLDALLARSEILVCLLPLTPATSGILAAGPFSRLPRGAAIVNCARGGHLVEADLLAALDSGQLSAAVLDVFGDEPLPPEHPFWRHERIIVTPHVAAQTHAPTAALAVADTLRRLVASKPLLNRVDASQRY